MKFVTAFLVFVSALSASAAPLVTGVYTTMPSEASDTPSMSQPLISLLIEPLKLATISVTGRVEMAKISETEKGLKVTAIDSAGASVFEEEVRAERRIEDGAVSYRLERKWDSGDEWGTSRGTTITWLKKEADGSLRVSLDMTSQRRTFVFPWGKLRSVSCWLKYKSKEPNQTPEPTAPSGRGSS